MQIRQFQAQRMQALAILPQLKILRFVWKLGQAKVNMLCYLVGKNPQHTLYAIERTREKFLAMQKQHGLEPRDNLVPVHADAFNLGCTCSISCSSRTFLYPLSGTQNLIIRHNAG